MAGSSLATDHSLISWAGFAIPATAAASRDSVDALLESASRPAVDDPILGLGPGRKGFRNALEVLFSAFPDLQITIDDLIAEGDNVVERWTGRATHP